MLSWLVGFIVPKCWYADIVIYMHSCSNYQCSCNMHGECPCAELMAATAAMRKPPSYLLRVVMGELDAVDAVLKRVKGFLDTQVS